jgi:hypothetical protein
VLHVVLEEVPLETDVLSLLVDQSNLGVRDGVWLSSPMVVVSVIGALKIYPISWRRWSPSLAGLTA